MIQKNLEELQSFLSTPKKLVIIGHRNPDGDAVGSTLALAQFLRKKGHFTEVVMPNEHPEFLNWLPEATKIWKFDKQNIQSKRAINNSDLIFLLDFNTLNRVGDDMEKTLRLYQKDFAMIDHHQQPDDMPYMYSDTSMCSTCQMVYHFIEMMDGVDLIDKNIATCLYTGIMTDTGSFRFRSTTSTTHRIIASLIDKGAVNDMIHGQVHDTKSYGSLQLLGQALQNLKYLPEFKTAFITLSDKEKKENDYTRGDTEGVVNYALSLKDTVFGVIFIEDKEQGIIKISFRSKGSFSVNQFARKYFEGGGHDNAAGGRSTLSLEDTVTRFISLLPEYKEALKSSYEV